MKNTIFCAIIVCAFTIMETVFADSCCGPSVSSWRLDANIGYFQPTSGYFRKVIKGGTYYQLMATYKCSDCFGVVFGVDYFSKEGRSTGTHSKTKLTLVPLTLGIKATSILYTFCNCSHVLQGYVLLGPRWYLARATNHVDYLPHHNNAQGFGGVIGAGLEYLTGCFSLNTFLNYSQANLHTHSSRENFKNPHMNVGGFVIGAGVGFNF